MVQLAGALDHRHVAHGHAWPQGDAGELAAAVRVLGQRADGVVDVGDDGDAGRRSRRHDLI